MDTIQRKEYIPQAWEDVSCPICNSQKRKHHDRFGPSLQYTYVTCLQCRNIYQSPRPRYDEHFLKAAYDDYFVFNEKYEYSESSYNDFKKELSEIIQFDSAKTSILDVGCAMGDFLHEAQKEYKKVSGVEISEKMSKFASDHVRGEILNCQFTNIKTIERFSCIHMSHVLEHIPNPNDWLQKVKSMLEPDGVLMICVPNMHSLTRILKIFLVRIGLRKTRWKSNWRTPDHLIEPTIPGMKYFLEKKGFHILSIYTYSRSNMISQGILGSFFHRVLKWGSNIRVYAKLAAD